MGTKDQLITVLEVLFAPEVLNFISNAGPPGKPQNQTGPDVLRDCIQFELLSQNTVISLLGLFHTMQVVLEPRFLGIGHPVDALQHRPLFVTPPVGAGRGGEFEGFDHARSRQMRPPAEVFKTRVMVKRYPVILDVLKELDFVRVILGTIVVNGFLSVSDLTGKGSIFLDNLGHALFNTRQVVWGKRPGNVEIVIPAFLDWRPDGRLGLGEQLHHRLRHHVGTGVPEDLAAFRVVEGEDFHRGVLGYRGL